MSPAMLDILRGQDPVKIIYLTAGDAAKDEAYWRSREQAIALILMAPEFQRR